MEPLRVEWRFAAPLALASDYPVHLDALLAWCVMDERERAGSENPWADADDLSALLERTEPSQPGGDDWCWKASRLNVEWASDFQYLNMVRKSEPLEFLEGYDRNLIGGRKRSGINTMSGQQRGYQWLLPCRWAERAVAYCIGDAQAIEAALSRLTHIGKMARNGFGRVKSVSVEPDEGASVRWRYRTLPAHEAQQPMPAPATLIPVQRPLRAPYWRRLACVNAVEVLGEGCE